MATHPDVLSPEGKQELALTDSGSRMSDILAAQARAQVQAHYLIAQSKKRDWDDVRTRLLALCDKPRFAEVAFKRKPGISDPMLTVRFAEAAQQIMGNLEPTRMIVFESPTQRIVRLGMSDLETNNHPTRDLVIEKVVERKNPSGRKVLSQRLNSNGEAVYLVEATEDEMFTKESAWGSKWERQLTLKHLPADIRYECEERCITTQRKADKADPDAAKKKLIDAFFSIGVRPDQLKEFLGVQSLDVITPHDLEQLRMVYTAIREGDTNWREVMEERNEQRGGKSDGGDKSQSNAAQRVREAAGRKSAKGDGKPVPPQTEQCPTEAEPQTEQQSSASSQPTMQAAQDQQSSDESTTASLW